MASERRLFDFLYADHEKVASLLSQLEDNGALKETSIRAQRGRDAKNGGSFKIAGIGAEAVNSKNLQYEVRQTYDPLWINSRKLIELVEILNPNGPILVGQLRLIDGDLLAFDQSVLGKLMGAASMRDFIASGINNENSDKPKSQKTINDNKKEAEVIQTYIATLGLSINFTLLSQEGGFWFNINRDYLYMHDTDIPLKYPIRISGSWKVLGIVDAIANDQFSLSDLDVLDFDNHVPTMVQHLAQLIGVTSVSFGRRISSNGIKPLVIFREIEIPSSE